MSGVCCAPTTASPFAALYHLMDELLEGYVRYLVAEKNLSPYTIRNYRADLVHFAAYLAEEEGEGVLAADRHAFRRYLARLREAGITTASIARKVSTIRGFYRFLVREGKLEANPLAGVSAPKRERRLPTILAKEHLTALIEAADQDTPQGLRNRAILELMYAAGVRLSEVVGLDRRHVDLGGKPFTIFKFRTMRAAIAHGTRKYGARAVRVWY